MIVDSRSVPSGAAIETELCIIGAGAAGISIARECANAPFRTTLLESGGMQFEEATQDLYQGESVGVPFNGLATSRLRYFGGTTNHWGGYCLPLDPIDFEQREGFPYHGWPFPRSHLDPWYERAQEVCRLGRYAYRPSDWGLQPAKIPAPFGGPVFESKVLQESPVHFGPAYTSDLRRAARVVTFLHANAFHLHAGETGTEISQLTVKTLAGSSFTVRARIYVLATGGIENARLLLASGKEGGNGIGNQHDLVGRFFMLHLAFSPGTIVPANPDGTFAFLNKTPWVPGTYRIDHVLGLSAAAMRARRLSNILIGFGVEFAPVVVAVDALKRLTRGEPAGGSAWEDLAKVVSQFEGVAGFAARKLLFGDGVPVQAIDLWAASEQEPNPASRITLGSQRDPLGMREVVADWQPQPEDRIRAAETIRLLGAELGRTGFGRLRSAFGKDDAWPAGFIGNEHHMGTTRMHRDPALGVVDENCRVHGVANLYVAGSSVFPTGGANNPTLTIVALALRLADHVKARLA